MADTSGGLKDSSPTAPGSVGSASLVVDASAPIGRMRNLQGAAGMPGPARGAEQIPDVSRVWESARVRLVRTYDWVSRLDTVDNPDSLFPKWSADPMDPSSYNFDATDSWIRQVLAIGADILFTIASAVPSNRRPAGDLGKYEQVVENLVRHYVAGWGGGGFSNAVTRWEFGDQPDFGTVHFDGTPDEFYEMYAAAGRAVKRVSPQLQFGGPCPAFSLDEGPYRQGFLDFVKRTKAPLDFFTWMWFTDDSRDPFDFRTVATELRGILDASGFETTELLLAYWNMTGIPNSIFADADAAAFQAAAAVYMQDSPVDRAVLFRVDTGTDLHYKILDPAGIFAPDGSENARTASYRFVGQTLAAKERLRVQGGDDNGFAVLAGRTEGSDVVRILLTNYEIPDAYLAPRDLDVFEFQVPIDSIKADMSFTVPPRRIHAKSAQLAGYSLEVNNLPWDSDTHEIVRYRVDDAHHGEIVGTSTGHGGTATIRSGLAAPAVELIEIRPVRR
jgi:hypothetical protein